MMPFIPLIPGSHYHRPSRSAAEVIQVLSQRRISRMSSGVASKGDADDQRPVLPGSQKIQISDGKHHVCLLIGDAVRRNLLKLPDEWFCLFQLYKRNGSLRSRSDKIFALYRRTCSDGYHLAPVPVRIRSRKLCPSFFQEAVDLFRRISAPIEKSLRRRSALICLIPETDHPGPALCSPKHRTLQRDTGIQESHDHPVAFKLQRRLILDLQDPRLLQAFCIHLCVAVGNGIISDGNILRIPKDLVPVHIKDTEIPVDILCTYAERVLFLSCEPNVNLPYKIHVVI